MQTSDCEPGFELLSTLEAASAHGHTTADTVHLFLADLEGPNSVLAFLAAENGVDRDEVRRIVEEALPPRDRIPALDWEGPSLSPRLIALVERIRARREATEGDRPAYIDLIAEALWDLDDSLADRLRRLGVHCRNRFLRRLSNNGSSGKIRRGRALAGPLPPISSLPYCRDMTQLARDGRLEPVVGRDDELRLLSMILAQYRMRNAILVGEPGVGKTALVEELARRIAAGGPGFPDGTRLVELDLGAMLSGTAVRGMFEQRLTTLLDQLEASGDLVILFVDEVHMLRRAGRVSGDADAANLLKPALARGHIQVIGATTEAEYRNDIESDGAFNRRFQPIQVAEISATDTLEILRQIHSRYETHHGVRYTDEALEAVVSLSEAHLVDRRFPDKAILVLDRAGAQSAIPVRESPCKTPTVTADVVASVVAEWTSLPADRLKDDPEPWLARATSKLREVLVGQKSTVSRLVENFTAFAKSNHRHIGPLLTLVLHGPPGCGIEECPGTLAEVLTGDAGRVIRLPMAQFGDTQGISRLIGAAPGLVGFDHGGLLTEPMRRDPHQVVVLEGIESADGGVLDLLARILTTGVIRDGKGREVRMHQAVFLLLPTNSLNVNDLWQGLLLRGFNLEALADDVIEFEPLEDATIDLLIDRMVNHATSIFGIQPIPSDEKRLTQAARRKIIEAGWVPGKSRRRLTSYIHRSVAAALRSAGQRSTWCHTTRHLDVDAGGRFFFSGNRVPTEPQGREDDHGERNRRHWNHNET